MPNPGGVSLNQLYRLLPAAQEEDLLEQVSQERRQYDGSFGFDQYWPLSVPWLRVPQTELEHEPAQVASPPTHWQAVGLVLHLLGGQVLDGVQPRSHLGESLEPVTEDVP